MMNSASCTLQAFWKKLQVSPQKVLLLDYDGTLAPFQLERDKAFPYPGTGEILDKIMASGKTRLIIVSGRAIKDLQPLLGLKHVPELWGSHGSERQLLDGSLITAAIDTTCLHNLKKAYKWMIDHGYECDCEKKPSSVAYHWRRFAKEEQRQLAETVCNAWSPLTDGTDLEIYPFDGGVEIRCQGFHKGKVVEQVMSECDQDAVLAYLGDDRTDKEWRVSVFGRNLTDEDAFKAMKDKGLSVLVRDLYRETMADCWLRPPDELLGFLQNWLTYSLK
ncbi:MAG: trehalose-phosphatase [Desulfobulbales bacterium]